MFWVLRPATFSTAPPENSEGSALKYTASSSSHQGPWLSGPHQGGRTTHPIGGPLGCSSAPGTKGLAPGGGRTVPGFSSEAAAAASDPSHVKCSLLS